MVAVQSAREWKAQAQRLSFRDQAFIGGYVEAGCCHAGSRLLIHESVKDAVVERVMAVGSPMQPGDPLDSETRMGAIVDEVQTERVIGYIEHGTQ